MGIRRRAMGTSSVLAVAMRRVKSIWIVVSPATRLRKDQILSSGAELRVVSSAIGEEKRARLRIARTARAAAYGGPAGPTGRRVAAAVGAKRWTSHAAPPNAQRDATHRRRISRVVAVSKAFKKHPQTSGRRSSSRWFRKLEWTPGTTNQVIRTFTAVLAHYLIREATRRSWKRARVRLVFQSRRLRQVIPHIQVVTTRRRARE